MNWKNKKVNPKYYMQSKYGISLTKPWSTEMYNHNHKIPEKTYKYSEIIEAINYAYKSITIDPSEVGKTVFRNLHTEKFKEYLWDLKK